jgi:putative CocE/NonD family hydrolase
MKTVTTFPHPVHEIQNMWIPLSDGIRLAARIWLPEDAESKPVPTILEYIPYRKRDGTAFRDSITHPYFAGHGYACVRVDLRGSGESDGILTDEYLEQELQDGVEILQWIAKQTWCSGQIGIIGISWGGFNGLQIAAKNPPELKAIITLCSTDDRYADDIHHMGGCLLGDNLSWASTMFAYNSCPPDPVLVGDRWRDMWLDRLKNSGLWLDTWLRHQRRDAYWKHGSICEDFSAITCPVYAISGWADGYSNAVFRLLSNLNVPRKGLIGPWSPGPAIGFLQEALRWWDKWLKGIETNIMEEPMLRVWMQDSVPPTTYYHSRPGRWVAESSWPSPNIEKHQLVLAPARLIPLEEHTPQTPLTIQSPLSVGLFAGKWCSYAAGPDLAHDQREEDGGALVFDGEPLEEALEVLGSPVVELDLKANRPVAMIAVRLSDIATDDKATRVTYGLLNLTHRNSSEHPEYLKPDESYRVQVPLNHIAQVFPKGHRLRIAISTSYWPLAWPPPEPVRLTIFTGSSTVTFPTRLPSATDKHLSAFKEAEGAPPLNRTLVEPEHHNWRVIRDLAKDESTLEVTNDKGVYRLDDIDLEVQHKTVERYTYQADDFESVRGETNTIRGFKRGDWSVRTETRTVLTSSATHFHIFADLDAYEDDKRVYCQSWDQTIPRDFV